MKINTNHQSYSYLNMQATTQEKEIETVRDMITLGQNKNDPPIMEKSDSKTLLFQKNLPEEKIENMLSGALATTVTGAIGILLGPVCGNTCAIIGAGIIGATVYKLSRDGASPLEKPLPPARAVLAAIGGGAMFGGLVAMGGAYPVATLAAAPILGAGLGLTKLGDYLKL